MKLEFLFDMRMGMKGEHALKKEMFPGVTSSLRGIYGDRPR